MTTEQAFAKIGAIQELIGSPGWELLTLFLEKLRSEYDEELHRHRADDPIGMTRAQVGFQVIGQVLDAPQSLIAELQKIVDPPPAGDE